MRNLIYIGLLAIAAFGCTDEKINDGRDLTENEQVNTYIKEEMTGNTSLYLWTEEIQGKSVTTTADPSVYVAQMRHSDDKWTSVEQDPLASRTDANENDDIETGYGFYLVNYRTDDGLYFSYVGYVYPGSPAEKAGLKRGDIITKVDGEYLTGDFSKLYTSSSVTVELGTMEGNTIYTETGKTVNMTAANTQIDPVLVDTTYEVGGKKVGYLHYTRFVYASDDDLDHLTTVFRRFKSEGVKEFILDLRYNPGGYEMAAQRLATLLAPESAVASEEVLLEKQWNAMWQAYYEAHGGVNLVTRLDKEVASLKFFNVYGPNEYHKGEMRSVACKAYKQITKHGDLELFRSTSPDISDGEQKRDFVYVKDCTALMSWLLENRHVNGIHNVGSGRARSFNDLGRAVFSAMQRSCRITYVDMPRMLHGKYQNFTQADMNWLDKVGCPLKMTSLEDGVTDFVQNYLSQPDPYL